LPNRPVDELSSADREKKLTEDLDEIVRCLAEVGGIDTLLGDLDIGVRLMVSAV